MLAAGDEEEAGSRERGCGHRWAGVRFAAGVHPHNAAAFAGRPADAASVSRSHGRRFDARAVGEIGLDYHYDFSPPAVQREVFEAQVALALELDRPVIIHTREATDDTFSVLQNAGDGSSGASFIALPATAPWRGARWTSGFYRLVCRNRDVSQGHDRAGGRAAGASRSPARRNRQPIPCAGPVSRQAERAGPRRSRARTARRASRRHPRRRWPAQTRDNFDRLFWPASRQRGQLATWQRLSALTPMRTVQYCESDNLTSSL